MKNYLSAITVAAYALCLAACQSDPRSSSDPGPLAPEYEAVDMGMDVLWATMNIGATKASEAGDYFAWGETAAKTNYDWTAEGDYAWGVYDMNAAPDCGMTKYNSTDGKTVLDAEDDVATLRWGKDWRMPTLAEAEALCNESNYSWEWTTLDGMNGFNVTSKATGNTIFLPAAGSKYKGDTDGFGTYCFYWTSTPCQRASGCGPAFQLNADEYGAYTADDARCYGQTVRAVRIK